MERYRDRLSSLGTVVDVVPGRRLAVAIAGLGLLGLALAAGPRAQEVAAEGEAWSMELAEPAPHPSLAYERLPDLETLSCWGCHETIAEEWALTQHAHAWIDPVYQKAIADKRRPQSCHGCHIPSPLHEMPPERFGRKPRPRAEEVEKLHFGVSCRSCHQGPDGTILGPWGAPTDAHTSVKSEHFVEGGSNALCLACHRTTVGPVIGIGKDFELGGLPEREMSCVACHMQAVERPAATDDDDNPTQVRPGRSHLLQTPRDPAFLASSFDLSARVEGEETVLTIANRAGHRVPGLVERRLVMKATALGGGGAELSTGEHTIDDVAYLPLEGSVDLRLQGIATAVRVTGDHLPPGSEEAIRFLEVEVLVD